jgi:hypothetical protein
MKFLIGLRRMSENCSGINLTDFTRKRLTSKLAILKRKERGTRRTYSQMECSQASKWIRGRLRSRTAKVLMSFQLIWITNLIFFSKPIMWLAAGYIKAQKKLTLKLAILKRKERGIRRTYSQMGCSQATIWIIGQLRSWTAKIVMSSLLTWITNIILFSRPIIWLAAKYIKTQKNQKIMDQKLNQMVFLPIMPTNKARPKRIYKLQNRSGPI